MTTLFIKYSSLFLILLLLTSLMMLAWLFPSAGARLGILFLLLSFLIASVAIVRKQRESYLQGGLTRGAFLRHIVLEITGAGLAMVLASLLGRTIAGMATSQISNDLIKLVAGILIGLTMGIIVGILVNKAWRRLVRT